MTRLQRLVAALSLLVVAVAVWVLLVLAEIYGPVRGIVNPRVHARALGTAVMLTVLASWHLAIAARRGKNGISTAINGKNDHDESNNGDGAQQDRAQQDPLQGSSPRVSFQTLVPLLVALALVPAAVHQPGSDLSHATITPGGRPEIPQATGTAGEATVQTTAPAESTEQARSATSSAQEDPEDRVHALEAVLAQPDPIIIDQDQFSRTIDLIWDYPERFVGRRVELEAFAFRRPDWPAEVFTAARLSIWCCIVDAAVIGLPAEADAWNMPREEDWIRIDGQITIRNTFDTASVTMRNVPVLEDIRWDHIAEPEFHYVFPAYW